MVTAYRQPGVKVTQEFTNLSPSLASFQLPNVNVGPAFQLVSDDNLGMYEGIQAEFEYTKLEAGNVIDLRYSSSSIPASEQYPISVLISKATVEVMPTRNQSGYFSSTNLLEFKDTTTNAFAATLKGDKVLIETITSTVIPGMTDGSVTDANRNSLLSGTVGQFSTVAIDDEVAVSGGSAGVVPGIYKVAAIVGDTLTLDKELYPSPAVGIATVNYSITRTAVQDPALNTFIVRSVVDVNTVLLESSPGVATFGISYSMTRQFATIPLVRDRDYTAEEEKVTILAGLSYYSDSGSTGLFILSGAVEASYRALIVSLATRPFAVENALGLSAKFGIGQITPANPLAFAMSMSLKNSVTTTSGLGLDETYYTDEVLAYQLAFAKLEATDMYCISPLTSNSAIAGLLKTHVVGMSRPEAGGERVGITSRNLITTETVVDMNKTDGHRVIVNTQSDGQITLGSKVLKVGASIFQSVQLGDTVVFPGQVGIPQTWPKTYLVDKLVSLSELELQGFIAEADLTDAVFYIIREDGLEQDGKTFYDSRKTFISDGVSVGSIFTMASPAPGWPSVPPAVEISGSYKVTKIVSENSIQIEQVPGVRSVQASITYGVTRSLDKDEQALFLASYAASIAERRLVVMWPDILEISTNTGIVELPGYYAACAIGAMTTGFPPQQGFTNSSVSGIQGLKHSNDYFSKSQLNKIASGGVMILAQDVPEALPFIRHELTTDRSSIKFQEYMVTKNVDYIAKFMRTSFSNFIGKYNIVDSTYDELKSVSASIMDYLKTQTSMKGIGGIIKSGSLTTIEEGASIDTVRMRFRLDIPIPLNNIDITIEV